MTSLRNIALISLVAVTALASGCVVEPVHRRPVVVERPIYRDSVSVDVVAPIAPPVWVVERVRPRPGFLWAHGYWRWNGRHYVAVRGHWEPVRVGYRYVHPHWERRGGGWHWRAGVWVGG